MSREKYESMCKENGNRSQNDFYDEKQNKAKYCYKIDFMTKKGEQKSFL